MEKFKALRKQDGQAMIILLILILIGSLLITTTLALGNSVLKIESHDQLGTNKLYSADVGIQQALWKLKNTRYEDLPVNPATIIDVPPSGVIDSNGQKVFSFISYLDTVSDIRRYNITSIAGPNVIHDHNLANQPAGYTRIVAFVSNASGDMTGIMNNAITSQNGYTIQGGQASVSPPAGQEHGPVANYSGLWPTAETLSQFYWQQVMYAVPYGSSSIDVASTSFLNAFYRDGVLDIENRGAAGLRFTLTGTVFVNGDLSIGTSGHNFILDLNGQTIYVNSNTVGLPYALQMGGKCTLTGSGAIIALGDIQFKPNIASGPSDYLLVMSVAGMSYLQPGGAYFGTVAGSTTVYDQNGTITWVDPKGKHINVPGVASGTFWHIRTWDISLQ